MVTTTVVEPVEKLSDTLKGKAFRLLLEAFPEMQSGGAALIKCLTDHALQSLHAGFQNLVEVRTETDRSKATPVSKLSLSNRAGALGGRHLALTRDEETGALVGAAAVKLVCKNERERTFSGPDVYFCSEIILFAVKEECWSQGVGRRQLQAITEFSSSKGVPLQIVLAGDSSWYLGSHPELGGTAMESAFEATSHDEFKQNFGCYLPKSFLLPWPLGENDDSFCLLVKSLPPHVAPPSSSDLASQDLNAASCETAFADAADDAAGEPASVETSTARMASLPRGVHFGNGLYWCKDPAGSPWRVGPFLTAEEASEEYCREEYRRQHAGAETPPSPSHALDVDPPALGHVPLEPSVTTVDGSLAAVVPPLEKGGTAAALQSRATQPQLQSPPAQLSQLPHLPSPEPQLSPHPQAKLLSAQFEQFNKEAACEALTAYNAYIKFAQRSPVEMARTLATANAAVAALPVCWNPRGFAADLATLAEVTIPKPINVLLIGAGCGAPLVALDRLGVKWDTALVYEIEDDCISVLHARWPGKIQVMKNDVYRGMCGAGRAGAPTDTVSRSLLKIEGSTYFVSERDIKALAVETRISLVVVSTECQGISKANAQRSFASESRLQIYNAALVVEWVGKHHSLAAVTIGEVTVPARPVLVLSEMVVPEISTEVLGSTTYGLSGAVIDASPFGATARSRRYLMNFPPRDKIHEGDIGPQTLDQCVRQASRGYYCVQGVISSDGKLGTIKASDKPNEYKQPVQAFGPAVPIDAEDLELVMGFDVGHTKAAGVSERRRWHMLGNSIQVRVLQHLLRPLVEDGWLRRA